MNTEVKTINISQKEVAAMRAYKTDAKTMADQFGISIKEMRDVLIKFGFAKPTKNSVDYIINPVFDFTINKVDNFNDITIPAAPGATYDASIDAIVEAPLAQV
jgi:hypothetical protein